MFFVITAEDFANPLGELVSTEQPLSLNYLAFAVNPLGLYCIEPRALGRQQTWHYPDPMAAGFDTAVVGADPASDLSWLLCQLALSQIRSRASLLLCRQRQLLCNLVLRQTLLAEGADLTNLVQSFFLV